VHFLININGKKSIKVQRETIPDKSQGDFIYIPVPSGLQPVDLIISVSGAYYIIGDPVYHEDREEAKEILSNNKSIGDFIKRVDGFYYIVFWNEVKKELLVTSSMFGILPVFYSFVGNNLVISSSFEEVVKNTEGSLETDDLYFLEKIVFNYPFLDRTTVKQIKTLNANNTLSFSEGKLLISKHTEISQYFTSSPEPLRREKESLANSFVKSIRSFLPDEHNCITLTGGLDGRTVVSAALSMKKDFYTYSYGGSSDNDITIPQKISAVTGITHKTLILDKEFINKHFWEEGKNFNKSSFGIGNISRGHYSYAVKHFIKNTEYIVSGNFGSEILRSMKIPGVMTSEILFSIFQVSDKKHLAEMIRNYFPLKYFTKGNKEALINELCDEVFTYLDTLPKNISDNQRFSIYLFEQVFPKYFGPEVMNQRPFIKHRAPFLSFRFITDLLKTTGAGANSDFLETNPMKRYGGQSLYGKIMEKCDQRLLNIDLDKGYKPLYFNQLLGRLKITYKYFKKRIFKKKTVTNINYQVFVKEESIRRCRAENLTSDYFDVQKIISDYESGEKSDDVHLFNIISASVYLNGILPALKK
jgi:hypothetical protein